MEELKAYTLRPLLGLSFTDLIQPFFLAGSNNFHAEQSTCCGHCVTGEKISRLHGGFDINAGFKFEYSLNHNISRTIVNIADGMLR